jgi:hypothetical protein
MVTGVLGGGRTGIRMNNPFPLMFPVFPSTWRERPPRLFQRTSAGNSTGMRMPPRGLSIIGSPPKRAKLARKVYFVSVFLTTGKLLAIHEIFGAYFRPDPRNKPDGDGQPRHSHCQVVHPHRAPRTMLFVPDREPDHGTLGRPVPSAFRSVHRRGRFSQSLLLFPLPTNRTGVPVLLYKRLPKRRTAANLADFGVDCQRSSGGGYPARTLKRRQQ